MKERVILFLYIIISLSSSLSVEANERDKLPQSEESLKDSIWNSYQAMPPDTLRVIALQRVFRKYRGEAWSIELLDTTLLEAQRLNYVDGELRTLYSYCSYYSYKSDTLHMRTSFERLKEASFKHQVYYYYFRMWSYLLEYRLARGESESVMLESDLMKQSATRLKDKKGVYYANLAKASALKAAGKEKEAIELYSEMSKDKSLKKNKRSDIHWYISRSQLNLNNYEEAISEMNRSLQLLNELYHENNIPPNRDKLLEKEVGLCKVYAAQSEANKLYHHLERAKEHYTAQSHPSLKIGYHLLWATYYQLIAQWESCFEMYNKALSLFDGTMPLYENSIHLLKAKALFQAGRYKESAESYQYATQMNDSINNQIIHSHQEALHANAMINQAMLEKSTIEREHATTRIALFTLLCLVVLIMLGHTIYTNRELRKRKKETHLLLKKAKKINQEKEEFLRNITHQIRVPLNSVVGFSNILSNQEEGTKEERELSGNCIKEDAAFLSNLIFDVLYLARLESGMMRLQIEPHNMVDLCNEAATMVQIRGAHTTPIILESGEASFIATTDREQFIKLLVSILTKTVISSEITAYQLEQHTLDQFKITIKSKSYLEEKSEEETLQKQILLAFINLFNGEYRKRKAANETVIELILPYHFAE